MANLKAERLNKRIEELEKETSGLYDQVAAIEAEKARLLEQLSSSRTLYFLNVPRELYEEWIMSRPS